VPCGTLRKALVVKSERDYLKNQIGVVRDSVSLLNVIVKDQDTLLKNKNNQIELYKKNEIAYVEVAKNKDKQISMYDDQLHNLKRERDIAFGLSIIILVLGIFVY
jgi:hypothetical protein